MKKNILFVDDDPLLLKLYQVFLDGDSDKWDISCASNGKQALEIMSGKKMEVVVSDMRMPEMSGTQLMSEICRLYPHVSRVIVSGVDDQETIAASMSTIHQFLPKPIRMKDLVGTLDCIGHLDSFLQDEKLKTIAGSLNSLPSFPTVFTEISKELNAEDPSVENIAAIVAKDPGLTAKMLQLANSAAFSPSQKVSNPFEAVQFIGLNTVRSIALSIHIFRNFENTRVKGFSANQLWNDAVLSSQIARWIMHLERSEQNLVEDAGTAAMLRNAGKLMLAQSLPHLFEQALAMAVEKQETLAQAEQEIFGATHQGIAAYLFGLWGLSAPMVEAVAFHPQPAKSGPPRFSPLTAVHVAHVLANEFRPDPNSGKPVELDEDYLAAVGRKHRLEVWRDEVKRRMNPFG